MKANRMDKPDWAGLGEKVYVVSGGYGHIDIDEAEVIRHTTARIFAKLADGSEAVFYRPKYSRQWEEVGARTDFTLPRVIFNPKDPKVAAAAKEARQRELRAEISKASETLRNLMAEANKLESE